MSFIGELLQRHPDHDARWPGEDLLTDATAAILRRVPGLPAAVIAAAGACDQKDVGNEVEVLTQQPAGGRCRIDLELRTVDFLVWIEIKDEAPQSGVNQLRTYKQALTGTEHESIANRLLVYLPRPGRSRQDTRGIADRDWEWERFGQLVQEWLRENATGLSPDQAWLLTDYVDYLKERRLMSSGPVPDGLPGIVNSFLQAQKALYLLQGIVDDRLASDEHGDGQWVFEQKGRGQPMSTLENYWSAFEATSSTSYVGCHFDWGARAIGQEPVDEIRFYAGVSCWPMDDNDPLRDSSLRERAARVADGLTPHRPFLAPGTFNDRTTEHALYRELPLTELGGRTSVGEQADIVVEFVDETFRILRDAAV